MCGRFTQTRLTLSDLALELGAEFDPAHVERYRPRYNIAPSDVHWMVRHDEAGRRRLVPATWGVGGPGSLHVNARIETAHAKPTFKHALQRRRCVVPADGFIEWTGPRAHRRPFWIRPKTHGLLLMAGIYEDAPASGGLPRFVVLTTAANEAVARLHDRMPVTLQFGEQDPWLEQGLERHAPVGLASDEISLAEVSSRVNSVAHDDAACLEPPASPAPPDQLRLF